MTALGLKTASLFVPHEHELAAVAEARGYDKRRESLTMEIAFDEPPHDSDFGGLELRTYTDGDHDTLIAALNEAFAEDPSWREVTPAGFKERFLGRHDFDPTLWFLVWDGDELAGFALDYPEFGTDAELGLVQWLCVDAQNVTGALRVYERVGMHMTRRFGIWQKDL